MFIKLTDIRYETTNDRRRPKKKIPGTMSLEKLAALIKKGQKFYERVGICEIHIGYAVIKNGKTLVVGAETLSDFGDVETGEPLNMLRDLRDSIGEYWYGAKLDMRHKNETINFGYSAEFGK